MKVGIRKPNIKKRIKARTTGKIKRKMKKSVNPLYGKKGMGYIKNPKRAVYNKVYHKTTIDLFKFKPAKLNSVFALPLLLIWYPLMWSCLLVYLMVKWICVFTYKAFLKMSEFFRKRFNKKEDDDIKQE